RETCRRDRSKRASSSLPSSALICRESGGCARRSRSAARVNDNSSATAMKHSNSRRENSFIPKKYHTVAKIVFQSIGFFRHGSHEFNIIFTPPRSHGPRKKNLHLRHEEVRYPRAPSVFLPHARRSR